MITVRIMCCAMLQYAPKSAGTSHGKAERLKEAFRLAVTKAYPIPDQSDLKHAEPLLNLGSRRPVF
jgi:hypothetical protein